jgi:hypothetical protein
MTTSEGLDIYDRTADAETGCKMAANSSMSYYVEKAIKVSAAGAPPERSTAPVVAR